MERLREKIEKNEVLLVRLKDKRQNLDLQIENLEHRLKNQRLALDSRVSPGDGIESKT